MHLGVGHYDAKFCRGLRGLKAILTRLVASETARAERNQSVRRRHSQTIRELQAEIVQTKAKLEQAERERDEERAENELADALRHAASMRAVAMWREAPGKALAMPDQADMEVWLLTLIDDRKAEAERAQQAMAGQAEEESE